MTEEKKEEQVNTPEVAEESISLSKERPMLIKRIQKNGEGGVDFVFSLSNIQTYILLNFAIAALLTQGLVQFMDIPEEQKEEEGIILGERIH